MAGDALLVVAGHLSPLYSSSRRPASLWTRNPLNTLLILIDEKDRMDLGREGNDKLLSPHIDGKVEAGATNSTAAILTGVRSIATNRARTSARRRKRRPSGRRG